MQIKIFLTGILLFLTCNSFGQWALQPAVGAAFPFNGFSTIVGAGGMFQIDVQKRIKEGRTGIGIMTGWARMHNDNSTDDLLIDSRLDLVPVEATIDFDLSTGNWVPYAGIGLGIVYYNLSYDISETEGKTVSAVSFSLFPRLGLRYRVNDRILPFIEANAPMVMDGPPMGVRNSEKETGYFGICAGLSYRFLKE